MEQYTVDLVKEYILKRFGKPADRLICWAMGDIYIWINNLYFVLYIDEIKRYMKGA